MAALPIDNSFLDWLGVELTAWSPDHAEMQLAVTPKLGNRSDRIHGGVLCTLLDSVAGYSGLYAAPDEPPLRGVTLWLTTNFLRSGAGKMMKGFGGATAGTPVPKGHLYA